MPYHTFGLLTFLGYLVGWIIRVDMSVTIVAMVKPSETL